MAKTNAVSETQKMLELAQQDLDAKKRSVQSELTWDSWQAQQKSEEEIPEKEQEIPFTRRVSIFQSQELERVFALSKSKPKDVKTRLEASLKLALKFDGFREVPSFEGITETLASIEKKFPNFAKVTTHLCEEMTLVGACKANAFHLAPILLDGEPGVGKTAFANAMAAKLGLPFHKISAGGMQHAAALTGTSQHWGNSQTGDVFNLLATGQSACAVLLIDEVDKLNDRSECSILPALLDLLEPESAQNYKDESLGLTFDASRLIILMTSNNAQQMNSALLSRCQIFTIDAPDCEQKRAIVTGEFERIKNGLEHDDYSLSLDEAATRKLVASELDTRAMLRAVSAGFAKAIGAGSSVVCPLWTEDSPKQEVRRSMGFL
jgi:ATP-dependent Lon protease